MIKKIVLALALMFLPFSAFAEKGDTATYNFNGYAASVEETKASLYVAVRSAEAYGYALRSSRVGNETINGQRVKRIVLTFDVPPEVSAKDTLLASDVYATRFSKGSVVQKVLLTVKTGNLTNVSDQVIWERLDSPQ